MRYRQSKVIGISLMYQEDQQLVLNHFLEELNRNITEIGVLLAKQLIKI